MSAPTVSVVMASYDGAALIAPTIDSVLAQTMRDFELIIVDDCSTDDTRGVIAGYADPRIRLLSTASNAGPVVARNLAVAQARGRFIAALDQDDISRPTRLASQLRHFADNPRSVAVGTAAVSLTASRLRPHRGPARTTPDLIRFLLMLKNPLVWSSMMIRGETARALEPFSRTDYLFAEDYDLYHRLAEFGDVARLDETLTIYRCHAGGASQRHRARMTASAAAVLARVYQPLFGDDARRRAALVTSHVADEQAVPDLATLDSLALVLRDVRRFFLAERPVDELTRCFVSEATSEFWWRAARGMLRQGRATLLDLKEHRPGFAAYRGLATQARLGGSLIGTTRAWQRVLLRRRAGLPGIIAGARRRLATG